MAYTKRNPLLTPEGADRLRAELELLRGPRRTELAARLRHAIQQGDLSENADYTSAKEEQAFLEGRILELEEILRTAQVVDSTTDNDAVAVGSTVVVRAPDGEEETYQLVGVTEANPRLRRVSYESPIGMALMGRRAGDTVTAQTPAGELRMEILEIR
jgi:transcription elongation factor GreA